MKTIQVRRISLEHLRALNKAGYKVTIKCEVERLITKYIRFIKLVKGK